MLPSSTYRLQIRPSFDLYAAADLCDYLATLGVGAVYLSPLLPSAKGSQHGYDVVGFDRVDAARGGIDGWTRLLAAARARNLGIVVDIVPNHTGVATPEENPAWWELLRGGPDSPYAHWFDVDWSRGRVLLPVLGDDFTPDQLVVDGIEPLGQRGRGRHRRAGLLRAPLPDRPRHRAEGGRDGGGRPRPAALRAGQLPPRGHRAELPPVLRGHRPGRAAGGGPGRPRCHARADPPLAAGGRHRRHPGRPPGRAGRPGRLPRLPAWGRRGPTRG